MTYCCVVETHCCGFLQAALGVTGVEGAFRIGCENTLRVSRANATNLTRLMQAVLTDPLICWSGDKRPGSKKVKLVH